MDRAQHRICGILLRARNRVRRCPFGIQAIPQATVVRIMIMAMVARAGIRIPRMVVAVVIPVVADAVMGEVADEVFSDRRGGLNIRRNGLQIVTTKVHIKSVICGF